MGILSLLCIHLLRHPKQDPYCLDSWEVEFLRINEHPTHSNEPRRLHSSFTAIDKDSVGPVSDSQQRLYGRILEALKSGASVHDREQHVECSSKLPTEIYETIIDYMGERLFYESHNTEDLVQCARVCRAWVPRVQMHLFSAIIPASDFMYTRRSLSGFQDAIRRKPFLLQYIKMFEANYHDKAPQPTTLLTSYHMPNLKRCSIPSLDLKTAHSSLSRFPSSATSVQILELSRCETYDVNQLLRFLTSFRSLARLILLWSEGTTLSGHDLPHLQFSRSKCSLQALAIQLTPNLSMLLRTFIKARPFVSHLRSLVISYDDSDYSGSFSLLQEITELLWHCSQSLEEVTVILGVFWMASYETLSSCKLRLSPQNMSDGGQRQFSADVGRLDDLLSDEMFQSFRTLRIRAPLRESIKFPELKARRVEVNFGEDYELMDI
ncbi:hypothetical protein QCA50_013511 [Cerrena zonata]|uniref:F-box domain-containing protein n=1 Tax=Cerrena zonata TaxID=2478898 RepID=A0AAW0FUR3_9APHY